MYMCRCGGGMWVVCGICGAGMCVEYGWYAYACGVYVCVCIGAVVHVGMWSMHRYVRGMQTYGGMCAGIVCAYNVCILRVCM